MLEDFWDDSSGMLALSVSSASSISSLLLIIVHACSRSIRSQVRKFVFWINFCDFFASISIVLSSIPWFKWNWVGLRIIEGFVIHFMYLSSYAWASALSIYLLILVSSHKDSSSVMHLYHCFVWSLPVLSTLVIIVIHFAHHEIMDKDMFVYWYSLKTTDMTNMIISLTTFYVPIIVCILLLTGTYFLVWARVRKERMFCSILGRSLLFIFSAVLVISCPLAMLLLKMTHDSLSAFPWNMHLVLFPLLGFFNSLLYGINKHFCQQLCCKKYGSSTDTEDSRKLLEANIPLEIPTNGEWAPI